MTHHLPISAPANPWPDSRLPHGAAAVLAALHMRDPRADSLASLQDGDWTETLDFCDRSQLTLILRDAARGLMPAWVRERTDRDAAKNLERLRIAQDLYRTLQTCLHGIDFLALKGLAQCPDFGIHAESRVQYDIDFFVPHPHLTAARDAVLSLGFESFGEMEPFPTDHIPPLIRKTGWEWRADFFDPQIPLSVELHFQFWNPAVEKLPVPDVEAFWARRATRPISGIPFSVLQRADALGYSSLHLLKHFFRGSARPFHIYELARFLQSHADDDAFWREWQTLHSASFQCLQAVAFRLAVAWFGCALGPIASKQIAGLPTKTAAWFDQADAESLSGTSKKELWLHLSLLQSRRDSWSVIRRRLLPTRLPAAVDAVHVPDKDLTLGRRVMKHSRYAIYLASRLWHHAVTLPRAICAGIGWWWRTRRSTRRTG